MGRQKQSGSDRVCDQFWKSVLEIGSLFWKLFSMVSPSTTIHTIPKIKVLIKNGVEWIW